MRKFFPEDTGELLNGSVFHLSIRYFLHMFMYAYAISLAGFLYNPSHLICRNKAPFQTALGFLVRDVTIVPPLGWYLQSPRLTAPQSDFWGWLPSQFYQTQGVSTWVIGSRFNAAKKQSSPQYHNVLVHFPGSSWLFPNLSKTCFTSEIWEIRQ